MIYYNIWIFSTKLFFIREVKPRRFFSLRRSFRFLSGRPCPLGEVLPAPGLSLELCIVPKGFFHMANYIINKGHHLMRLSLGELKPLR